MVTNIRKKSILAFLCAFILSACSITGDTASPEKIAAVVEGAKKDCKFIPAVASIAAILGVPGAPAVGVLVDQICDEVNKIPVLESSRRQVQDVEVEISSGSVEGVLLPR